MVLNKTGQIQIYALMLGVVIIVFALAIATPVKKFVDDARGEEGMNCSLSTISDFDKAGCFVLNIQLFYFIAILLAIGGAVIGAKIILT